MWCTPHHTLTHSYTRTYERRHGGPLEVSRRPSVAAHLAVNCPKRYNTESDREEGTAHGIICFVTWSRLLVEEGITTHTAIKDTF